MSARTPSPTPMRGLENTPLSFSPSFPASLLFFLFFFCCELRGKWRGSGGAAPSPWQRCDRDSGFSQHQHHRRHPARAPRFKEAFEEFIHPTKRIAFGFKRLSSTNRSARGQSHVTPGCLPDVSPNPSPVCAAVMTRRTVRLHSCRCLQLLVFRLKEQICCFSASETHKIKPNYLKHHQ